MAAIVIPLAPINALTIDEVGAVNWVFADPTGLGFQSEAEFRQWIVGNATDQSDRAKTVA